MTDVRRNLWLGVLAISMQPSLMAQARRVTTSAKKSLLRVPFVGCKSDGQVGPLRSPDGNSKGVRIAPALAQQLAYYKAENGSGVLAPRGWSCFGTYGSSGSNLYVTPQPIAADVLFSDGWIGFTGSAVQLSGEDGGTSGRFGVAQIIARVFPAHRAFVRSVIKERMEPASSFPFGPYPQDKLTYKSREMVEYETPANAEGLGTRSRLQENSSPIDGVVILSGSPSEPSLSFLSTRLPAHLNSLTEAIIRQVERDASRPDR